VALKADSPAILHKTEAGALRLDLASAEQVRAAYAAIGAPSVLVQEMVHDGVEVIVGAVHDDQLGPIVLFGMGGVLVEVYQDVALRRCPIGPAEAREMIGQVRGAPLLRGFRGAPPADVEALADTLEKISQLAAHLAGRLAELDVNPLMVLPAGGGVKAVDALALLNTGDAA
jgi:acetyltransferase